MDNYKYLQANPESLVYTFIWFSFEYISVFCAILPTPMHGRLPYSGRIGFCLIVFVLWNANVHVSLIADHLYYYNYWYCSYSWTPCTHFLIIILFSLLCSRANASVQPNLYYTTCTSPITLHANHLMYYQNWSLTIIPLYFNTCHGSLWFNTF